MAVSGVAAAHDNAVSASLEGTEDKHGVYTAGAGNTYDLDIGRVVESVGTCEVSARI